MLNGNRKCEGFTSQKRISFHGSLEIISFLCRKLIEKLDEIAKKDEVVLPDVPEAPDLDAVVAEKNTLESPQNQPENNPGNTWGLSEGEEVWADAPSEEE